MLGLAEERRRALGLPVADDCLAVSIVQQTLVRFHRGVAVRAYHVSTARAGAGCVENSLRTPTGLHRVAETLGAGAPAGMVFKARQPTGKLAAEWPTPEDNLITSRILWLEGLEEGLNRGKDGEGRVVDTHARFVYIHGTNQRDRLGQPNSHGCVLLADEDVIELFDATPSGTLVMIG